RAALELHLEDLVAITAAVAVRAAQIDIGEKLHLDVLEAVPRARRTAAVPRVEAERAGCVAPLLRKRLRNKELADRIEGADVARGIGPGRPPDRRLVHQHH